MIPEKFVKFAALGALGVAPGAFAIYALSLLLFHPTPSGGAPGNGGGIDMVNWWVLAAAMFVPISLAAAWHVGFGTQLRAGKNTCPGV